MQTAKWSDAHVVGAIEYQVNTAGSAAAARREVGPLLKSTAEKSTMWLISGAACHQLAISLERMNSRVSASTLNTRTLTRARVKSAR